MTEKTLFNKTICIESKHLTSTLQATVNHHINVKYEKLCTRLGYIFNIENIVIDDLEVSYLTPDVKVFVSFTAEIFSPKTGSVIKAKLNKVLQNNQGSVFYATREVNPTSNEYEEMRAISIIIPFTKTDIEFTECKLYDVEINAVKYVNSKYICVGKIV